MKYTCPNGHGSSDIYPICHTCEATMNTASKAIVEEAPKKEVIEETPKVEVASSKKKK